MPPLSNGRLERLAEAGVYCTPGESCASDERIPAEQRQILHLLSR